nr:hypothetical protein GCM10020092_076130 [Actinoplanes digitatis]
MATVRVADQFDLLAVGERPGPGHVVLPADVFVAGERRHGDRGEVGRVDRRPGRLGVRPAHHVAGGQLPWHVEGPLQRVGRGDVQPEERPLQSGVHDDLFDLVVCGGHLVALPLGVVVDLGRGLEHDAFHPGALRRGNEARPDTRHDGEQERGLDAGQRGGQAVRVAEVPGDDLRAVRQVRLARVAGECAYGYAGGDELLDDGASDGRGGRGNQNHDGLLLSAVCSGRK